MTPTTSSTSSLPEVLPLNPKSSTTFEITIDSPRLSDQQGGLQLPQSKVVRVTIDTENFHVPTDGNWSECNYKGYGGAIRVKINPEKDIMEFMEGPLKGQQVFIIHSAQRELNKLGKRLPFEHETYPEASKILQQVGSQFFTKPSLPDMYGGYIQAFWFRPQFLLYTDPNSSMDRNLGVRETGECEIAWRSRDTSPWGFVRGVSHEEVKATGVQNLRAHLQTRFSSAGASR